MLDDACTHRDFDAALVQWFKDELSLLPSAHVQHALFEKLCWDGKKDDVVFLYDTLSPSVGMFNEMIRVSCVRGRLDIAQCFLHKGGGRVATCAGSSTG